MSLVARGDHPIFLANGFFSEIDVRGLATSNLYIVVSTYAIRIGFVGLTLIEYVVELIVTGAL